MGLFASFPKVPPRLPTVMVALAGALAMGCTANAPGGSTTASNGASAPTATSTPSVAVSPAASSNQQAVIDPATGKPAVPPVAGAVLQPTDPARPGFRNWITPDGRSILQAPEDRASCATRGPDGQLIVTDCALALPEVKAP